MNLTTNLTAEPTAGVDLPTASTPTLRGIDLNLLTVFDAVMQEQNITRAAKHLNMSQPAVSNAVSRLKLMFKDDLFLRYGRGIQPTQRAKQLFGPVRQALQLVKNELPDTEFVARHSTRQFYVAIGQPNDVRLVGSALRHIQQLAPNVELLIQSETGGNIDEKLKYQEMDFVVDYARPSAEGFRSVELFHDKLVVLASKDHPRLGEQISMAELQTEKHAQLIQQEGMQSFTEAAYEGIDCKAVYRGLTVTNLGYVVTDSDLITIVPIWIANKLVDMSANLKVLELPATANDSIKTYLSWHESTEQSAAHIWLREQVLQISREKLQ
jgi:LysR family transcriptional activator for leuABCD operon